MTFCGDDRISKKTDPFLTSNIVGLRTSIVHGVGYTIDRGWASKLARLDKIFSEL